MSKEYIYFSASLPDIQFEGSCPMTVNEFLFQCESLLDSQDYQIINTLLDLEKKDCDLKNNTLDMLLTARDQYNNAIAEFRAERAGKDPADYVRGFRHKDEHITEVLQQAAKEDNLNEGQKIVDKARWEHYDFLQTGHYNDIIFIACYGLKLAILEKQSLFDAQVGLEKLNEFKKLCMPDDDPAIV